MSCASSFATEITPRFFRSAIQASPQARNVSAPGRGAAAAGPRSSSRRTSRNRCACSSSPTLNPVAFGRFVPSASTSTASSFRPRGRM
ncbi:hypothetical protein [Anaeromyxobacter dehalogenans]|uniref:hypothetical protein n=1 Tax=Anaeromyxobacter dehalogenans TaxID=161493 RepID=UPI00059D30C3|nr:hypothetical protein [Anaeromyxobacter dehalogenans]